MSRYVLLGAAALMAFCVVAGIMIKLMPMPAKDSDYLVVGSVSTLVSLFVVFLGLVGSTIKSANVFFKRRKKQR